VIGFLTLRAGKVENPTATPGNSSAHNVMTDKKRRCSWAEGNALHEAYHDTEWGVPIHDSRELWELLMLEGFQAGLAWIVVLKKRDALRAAFRQFDPDKVARFTQRDVQRLLKNEGIIRSRAKINATIEGARIFVKMRDAGEDFATYVWNMAGGKPIQRKSPVPAQTPLSVQISKALRQKGFKFVGPVIVYAWMQAAGIVNDHAPYCFRGAEVRKLR
jgi:DNA-3-methyladenine glycosylase I